MRTARHFDNRGSALLAASISAGSLVIVAAGLMAFVATEHTLSQRSHQWTQFPHLAEAAVEQGLAEFSYRYIQNGGGFNSADGWEDGGGAYSLMVSNFTDNAAKPIGYGIVTVADMGAAYPQVFGEGIVVAPKSGAEIARAVKVTLASSSRHPTAMVAKNTLTFNGNNAYVDSFDSSDPSKSTNGLYAQAKRQPHGDVTAGGTGNNAITLGNGKVYGLAQTGDGGVMNINPNGSIGPTFVNSDRVSNVAAGESTGWITHDFQADIPDAALPGGTTWTTLSSVPDDINAGDYKLSSISLTGTKQVTVNGYVRLRVAGSISMAGQSRIVAAPGGRLEIYAAGTVSVAGNGVSNQTGLAANYEIIGLPTCSSVSVTGNGDVSGAIVAASITISGNDGFHYDEALKSSRGGGSCSVASWQSGRFVDDEFVAD